MLSIIALSTESPDEAQKGGNNAENVDENMDYQLEQEDLYGPDADDLEDTSGTEFTAEQEALFERRQSEGYDIPDEVYLSWLKFRYPHFELTSGSIASNFLYVQPTPLILIPSSGSPPFVCDSQVCAHPHN